MLLLLAACLAVSPAVAEPVAPPIVERPLPWDADREALTRAYTEAHYGVATSTLEPRVVVLHWTAGATADAAWNTFAPSRLGGRPELAGGGELNVSAHYLVDRDGTIARLLPDDRVARHAIGLNLVAIGIENVGGGDRWPLTEAQVDADAALVRWLAAVHPITHLVGHFETGRLEGTPLFTERDPNYRNAKPDPGPVFMARVRAELADLDLEPR